MASRNATKKPGAAGISDEAVAAKTGMTWPQWLKVIDAAGGKKMDHKQIVAWLGEHHPTLGGWWTQMVTVGYEQARGLRQKHEKPDGFEIGRSRTLGVPVAKAWRAWSDKRARHKWLELDGGSDIEVRQATKDKSMRLTWADGVTHVDVYFYARGDGRSQVAVQHRKLKSAREAERRKAYWSRQLARLKEHVEA